MKLAAVNITIIEFSSQWITFTNILVQIEVGITEEICLIAVSECLRIFKEFCYQGNPPKTLNFSPLVHPTLLLEKERKGTNRCHMEFRENGFT
jgi:hypothetical protein